MKKSKLFLYIGVILAVMESALTILQGNIVLPSWITLVNWGLFIITVICFVSFFVLERKEQQ